MYCINVHRLLLSMPVLSFSKLLSRLSGVSFVAAAWETLDSGLEWILWVVDRRLLFENSQLDLLSLPATVESLLLEATAFFDTLPLRVFRALSVWDRWKRWTFTFEFSITGEEFRRCASTKVMQFLLFITYGILGCWCILWCPMLQAVALLYGTRSSSSTECFKCTWRSITSLLFYYLKHKHKQEGV